MFRDVRKTHSRPSSSCPFSLGGAPLQASGPAAGLTVLVYGVVQTLGWPAARLVTLFAGVMRIALGTLKIGRATLGVTPAVVRGTLAGIGPTIALANVTALPGLATNGHVPTIALGGFAVAILMLWPRLPKAIQTIPGRSWPCWRPA